MSSAMYSGEMLNSCSINVNPPRFDSVCITTMSKVVVSFQIKTPRMNLFTAQLPQWVVSASQHHHHNQKELSFADRRKSARLVNSLSSHVASRHLPAYSANRPPLDSRAWGCSVKLTAFSLFIHKSVKGVKSDTLGCRRKVDNFSLSIVSLETTSAICPASAVLPVCHYSGASDPSGTRSS